MSVKIAGSTKSRPLVGNFEENVLNLRIDPIRTVEGFTAEVRASHNLFQPSPLRSKVRVSIFSFDDSFPYLGQVDLHARRYKLPKKGTLQVTLFNPNGTLVKLWILKYDLSEMPPSSQTFLRQKTFLLPKQTAIPQPVIGSCPLIENHDQNQSLNQLQTSRSSTDNVSTTVTLNSSSQNSRDRLIKGASSPPMVSATKRRIKYMIQFNIVSSKSGRIYLNKDLKIFVSKKSDLETANQLTKQDYELKSIEEMPNNPTYFSR